MSRICYINGRLMPTSHGSISIHDRGFNFSDGVYQVISFVNGKYIDLGLHLDRMEVYLAEIAIPVPLSRSVWEARLYELLRLNRLTEGSVYIQVTRGEAPRSHAYQKGMLPNLVMTVQFLKLNLEIEKLQGCGIITHPDERWEHPHIKSISLLPNILAKQKAVDQGAFEAFLYTTEGIVTEGSHSNAWIVREDGVILTHPVTDAILPGTTRERVLALAEKAGLPVEEKPFTLEDLKHAAEVFLTASRSMVKPVLKVNGHPVRDGKIGPVTRKLAALYFEFCKKETS